MDALDRRGDSAPADAALAKRGINPVSPKAPAGAQAQIASNQGAAAAGSLSTGLQPSARSEPPQLSAPAAGRASDLTLSGADGAETAAVTAVIAPRAAAGAAGLRELSTVVGDPAPRRRLPQPALMALAGTVLVAVVGLTAALNLFETTPANPAPNLSPAPQSETAVAEPEPSEPASEGPSGPFIPVEQPTRQTPEASPSPTPTPAASASPTPSAEPAESPGTAPEPTPDSVPPTTTAPAPAPTQASPAPEGSPQPDGGQSDT